MKVPLISCHVLSALVLSSVPFVRAQGLPQSQPKLLTIVQESVKPGHGADHAKHEAGWPAAFEKAKSPDYYLAITSMSGPGQAWYLAPYASHAAAAESMKREDKDPVLSAELARLSRRDAEFLDGVRILQLLARPELSYGAFPDLAKVRFYEVSQFSVRPGKNAQVDALFQRYATVRKRAVPDSSYRVYTVIAGMATPTYFVFSSVDDYAKFDDMAHTKTMSAATPEDRTAFDTWGDYVVREETQRFRVDPGQSYVPKETRVQDPEFWNPK